MTDATAQASAAPAAAPTFFWRMALILGGWTTLHMLIVAALLHASVPGGWWTFLAVYLLVLLALVVLIRGFSDDSYPGVARRLFVQRPFWYAQILLFPTSVFGAALWIVGLPFGRAVAFGRAGALATGALMLVVIVAGYFGSKALVVRRREFAFADLPAAFEGMTIAQLSDTHVGPHTSARYLRRIVRAVESAKPDLIAFTGDQVDDYDQDVARFGAVFGHLRAPLGVFAIAGNHDVYAGWPGVRAGMEAAGMRVLVNEAEKLKRGDGELWIVGTGDPAGVRSFGPAAPEVAPDIERCVANVPTGSFVLALAHNPALWPALAQRGVQMTLSGHTHHGQISIPALNWCLSSPFLEFSMGTYERGGSQLYINPGTNYWALPLRLGAWPEVTIVTLRRQGTRQA